jgi:hypothetical protein
MLVGVVLNLNSIGKYEKGNYPDGELWFRVVYGQQDRIKLCWGY